MKDAQQEQYAQTRRDQILDAAAIVFAQKGFHPTTIKDIAREAKLADGTIYIYFANKTALLLGILERMRSTALQDIDLSHLDTADFRTFMHTYLSHPLMALKAQHFALFRIVMSEILVNPELRAVYYREILEPTLQGAEMLFQRWVDQRAIREVNVPLVMRVVSAIMMGLMVEHILGDPLLEEQWEQLPATLTDLLINGLRRNE
jgi:AcrR family transcriptional regulator